MQEYERVSNYLDSMTETKLINTFLDEYIGDSHTQTLLTMQSSGLVYMIRNNNIEELRLVYNML